jgi:hypothetical protein
MKKLLILTLFVAGLTACQPFQIADPDNADPVIGVWVYDGWSQTDTASIYVLRNRLADNQYGYVFKPGGKMVQRVNSGWCGTPPITTADYSGTWQTQGNRLVLRSENWSGPTTQTLTIVRRQGNQLLLR